jgi:surface antigen
VAHDFLALSALGRGRSSAERERRSYHRSVTRTAAVAAVVVAFAGVAAWAAVSAPHGRAAGSAAGRAPIVYGYPYTDRCPGAGIADVVDRWGMYACNCTSYVAWALSANGKRTGWFVRGAMDAWNWVNVARRAGFVVDTHPAVGAVADWPHVARPYGHVAYVSGVEPDGTIDVAEYNSPFTGEAYVFDTREDASTRGAFFIHVPARINPRRSGARSG